MSNAHKAIIVLAVLALAVGIFGTGCGQPQMLEGKPAEVFRRITKHKAITLSDKTVIYGTENPPSACLVAHEEAHMRQVGPLCHFLRKAGYIDEDELSCMAIWVSVYSLDAAVHGAKNNRFELGARADSEAVCAPSP